MKKVVRYLLNREVAVSEFPWQEEGEVCARLLTDNDWAGANRQRKSTSGGVVIGQTLYPNVVCIPRCFRDEFC